MMTDRERLDQLGKWLQNYMSNEATGPVPGYSDKFYDGVLWAFGKLVQIYPGEETIVNAPQISSDEDLIRRSAVKEKLQGHAHNGTYAAYYVDSIIDNAPAAEDIEEPYITECRNAAIEQNIPLYFVYYEETGILEIYKTDTKELFERRRLAKPFAKPYPVHEFKEIVTRYLDAYSDWIGREDPGEAY